ncbi:MAG: hypothetical protein ACJAVR_003646 [Paracoccaceae bacterium]|jgi:hypothetical protein
MSAVSIADRAVWAVVHVAASVALASVALGPLVRLICKRRFSRITWAKDLIGTMRNTMSEARCK